MEFVIRNQTEPPSINDVQAASRQLLWIIVKKKSPNFLLLS